MGCEKGKESNGSKGYEESNEERTEVVNIAGFSGEHLNFAAV